MARDVSYADRSRLEVPVPRLVAAGDVLRRARRDARMSQQFLGVLLGTTQQTVSRWEQGLGAPEVPTQDALRQILSLPDGLWSHTRPVPLAV